MTPLSMEYGWSLEQEQDQKQETEAHTVWFPNDENNSFSSYSAKEADGTFHSKSIILIHLKLDCCTICLDNQIIMTKKITFQKNKPKATFQAWNGRDSLYLKGGKFSWQLGIREHHSCNLFHFTWPTTLKSSSKISSSYSYYIICSSTSKSAP